MGRIEKAADAGGPGSFFFLGALATGRSAQRFPRRSLHCLPWGGAPRRPGPRLVDEAGGEEQRAPAGVTVPSQRHVEALPDHAVEGGTEPGPRVHPPTEWGNLGRPVSELKEAQGGDEECAAAVMCHHACPESRDTYSGKPGARITCLACTKWFCSCTTMIR